MSGIRIQKALSDAGIASRRSVEELILEGRIAVNGKPIREVPCFIDPEKDQVTIDDSPVVLRAAQKLYILLNKPRGVVCTEFDPEGRPRALDLIPPTKQRLYCVGNLDQDSTGLVLLTNDGELTRQMTHARTGLQKRYVVEVEGRLDEHAIDAMKYGIYMDGRKTRGAFVKVLRRSPERSMLEVDLVETINREVRRVMASTGHKVRRLKRVGLGPLTDVGLKIGHFRPLRPHEIRALQNRQNEPIEIKPDRRPRQKPKKKAE